MTDTLLAIIATELGLTTGIMGFFFCTFIIAALRPVKQDPLIALLNQNAAAVAAEAKKREAATPTTEGKVDPPGMYV